MKKTALFTLALIIGIVAGVVGSLLFVSQYTDRVSNSDLVESQIAQVMHARLITEGKGDKVVWMVEQMIENGLSTIDYREAYPGTETQTQYLIEEVEKLYQNQGKDAPPRVETWIGQSESLKP